jgi:hypothetical protein
MFNYINFYKLRDIVINIIKLIIVLTRIIRKKFCYSEPIKLYGIIYRSSDKKYARDNRLMKFESPHR